MNSPKFDANILDNIFLPPSSLDPSVRLNITLLEQRLHDIKFLLIYLATLKFQSNVPKENVQLNIGHGDSPTIDIS